MNVKDRQILYRDHVIAQPTKRGVYTHTGVETVALVGAEQPNMFLPYTWHIVSSVMS